MGNIFIAVIGEAYTDILKTNQDRWNRDVNELMYTQLWMRLSHARLKQLHRGGGGGGLSAEERKNEIAQLNRQATHSKTAGEMEMPTPLRVLLELLSSCCGDEIHSFPLPYRTAEPEPDEPADDDGGDDGGGNDDVAAVGKHGGAAVAVAARGRILKQNGKTKTSDDGAADGSGRGGGSAFGGSSDDPTIDAVWRWRTVIRPAERLFRFDWARLPPIDPLVLEDALKEAKTRRREQKELQSSISLALVQGISAKLDGLEARCDAWFLGRAAEQG